MKTLILNQAEVDLKNKNGETALIFGILFNLNLFNYYVFNILASMNGHLEIVRCLCQNKADTNLQEKDGRTALIFGILCNLYLNLNLNYLFEFFKYFSYR